MRSDFSLKRGDFKAVVNIVQYHRCAFLSKSCMFFGVFRFAKKLT